MHDNYINLIVYLSSRYPIFQISGYPTNLIILILLFKIVYSFVILIQNYYYLELFKFMII